ncbi:43kDa postsynaptic protein [Parasponia andersonii]|uniref:43kDa postsynaptic protein n=1 Tax=Parasponia andersonii TaxID=3476 RepID=A0A2P5CV93_PARAD|nr:43kDa postsynaptic protein [Parasponia andersonii]
MVGTVVTRIDKLGANINAYRPANALVRNDDHQNALDIARLCGHTKVSFDFRIIYAISPAGYERLVQAYVELLLHVSSQSKCLWIVVTPMSELALYSNLKDAQPCTVIPLWNAQIVEPNMRQSDPTLAISDHSTKSRITLASATQGDPSLSKAWQGISQAMYSWSRDREACTSNDQTKAKDDTSICANYWAAPIEGAFIPCGHMAGCMSCLIEIKATKGVCPICRCKINQLLRLSMLSDE